MKSGFRYYLTSLITLLYVFLTQEILGAPTPHTLQQALDAAIEHSLALKQADAQIQMLLADCLQAGLRINPVFILEVDNLGGRGSHHGFSSSSPSVALSQIFELGNKRSARQNAAAALANIALWDREILKQELLHKVTDLIIDAIANAEKVKFLNAANENAIISLKCISEKVNHGKANPILLKETELELNRSILNQKKAARDLSSSIRELNLICGCTFTSLDEITFPFFDFCSPKPLDDYLCALSNHPEASKYRSVVFAANENYYLQKANAVPDLEVTAGISRDNRHRDHSISVEFDIALPIFDRNQGNICRSSWESLSASYKLEEFTNSLKMACDNVHDHLLRSFETVSILHNESLPAAFQILQAYEEGNNEGKYECLDILSAQSHPIELQIQLIDALAEYHHLRTELQYLCGNCF